LVGKWSAPGFVLHHVNRGDMNLEQTIQSEVATLTVFPKVKFIADEILADGDKIIIRFASPATHKGTFAEIPPLES